MTRLYGNVAVFCKGSFLTCFSVVFVGMADKLQTKSEGTAHETLPSLFVYLSPRSDVLQHRNALVPSLSFVIGVTTVRSLLRGTQNSD